MKSTQPAPDFATRLLCHKLDYSRVEAGHRAKLTFNLGNAHLFDAEKTEQQL